MHSPEKGLDFWVYEQPTTGQGQSSWKLLNSGSTDSFFVHLHRCKCYSLLFYFCFLSLLCRQTCMFFCGKHVCTEHVIYFASFYAVFHSDIKKDPLTNFCPRLTFSLALLLSVCFSFLQNYKALKRTARTKAWWKVVLLEVKRHCWCLSIHTVLMLWFVFLPTAVNNGLLYTMVEAGWSRWIQGQSPTWRAMLVLSNYLPRKH